MNKTLYRFTGAFVALLGLAYLGHQVFVDGSPAPAEPAAAPAPAPAPAAAPPAAVAPAPNVAAVATPVVSNANAYAVYPDKATDAALGLSYTSFTGDFSHYVVITPLPPNAAGRATLRLQAQPGHALHLELTDKRCASRVHVVVNRVDDKKPLATAALSSSQPKLSAPFDDGKIPPLLVEVKMDDSAKDNYFCGVAATWSE